MNPQNRTAQYDFTILVPFFNEKENAAALENRLGAYLEHCPVKACVLFVNDGSTDGGDLLIREACARHPHFYWLDLAGALKTVIPAHQSVKHNGRTTSEADQV